jgi:hypothetical protein
MEDQKYKSEMLQETKEQTRLIEKIYNNVLFFLWLTVTSIVASAIIIAMVLSKPADIDETTSVEVEAANPATEAKVTTAPAAVEGAAEVTTAPAAVEGAAEAQSVETKPGVDEEYAN